MLYRSFHTGPPGLWPERAKSDSFCSQINRAEISSPLYSVRVGRDTKMMRNGL